jgi:hypothetical protein
MRKTFVFLLAVLTLQLGSAQVKLVLNQQEGATLARMAEEEKLAYDVYMDMAELWEAQAFIQIAAAEQRHLEMIKQLADRYGIKMSKAVRSGERGLYDDAALQQSYLDLTQKGQQSLTAAFQVGALIEEMDIRDLKAAIAETENANLKATYSRLMEASNNHLIAFSQNLENAGEAYVPSYITTADYDAIMRGSTKACQPGKNQQGCKGKSQQGCKGNKQQAEAGCPGKQAGQSGKACCSGKKGQGAGGCQGKKTDLKP